MSWDFDFETNFQSQSSIITWNLGSTGAPLIQYFKLSLKLLLSWKLGIFDALLERVSFVSQFIKNAFTRLTYDLSRRRKQHFTYQADWFISFSPLCQFYKMPGKPKHWAEWRHVHQLEIKFLQLRFTRRFSRRMMGAMRIKTCFNSGKWMMITTLLQQYLRLFFFR